MPTTACTPVLHGRTPLIDRLLRSVGLQRIDRGGMSVIAAAERAGAYVGALLDANRLAGPADRDDQELLLDTAQTLRRDTDANIARRLYEHSTARPTSWVTLTIALTIALLADPHAISTPPDLSQRDTIATAVHHLDRIYHPSNPRMEPNDAEHVLAWWQTCAAA